MEGGCFNYKRRRRQGRRTHLRRRLEKYHLEEESSTNNDTYEFTRALRLKSALTRIPASSSRQKRKGKQHYSSLAWLPPICDGCNQSQKLEILASVLSYLLFIPATTPLHLLDGKGDANLGISAKNVSLSDFLGRSLHRNCILPDVLQGKQEKKLLTSNGNAKETQSNIIKVQEGKNDVVDESIFKQFNQTNADHEDSEGLIDASSINEVEAPATIDAIPNSRKRKITSRGGNENCIPTSRLVVLGDDSKYLKENINCVHQQGKRPKNAYDLLGSQEGESSGNHKKHVVVLGDDPKPRRRHQGRSSVKEKQRTAYNHYENGVGWWDNERVGIDNGGVDLIQGWEGKSSASLGGLDDWH